MANPVAIYSPDPAAPPSRGGSGPAQIIQLHVYPSGARPRFTPDPDSPARPGAGDVGLRPASGISPQSPLRSAELSGVAVVASSRRERSDPASSGSLRHPETNRWEP